MGGEGAEGDPHRPPAGSAQWKIMMGLSLLFTTPLSPFINTFIYSLLSHAFECDGRGPTWPDDCCGGGRLATAMVIGTKRC
jgi:hypothetical protein